MNKELGLACWTGHIVNVTEQWFSNSLSHGLFLDQYKSSRTQDILRGDPEGGGRLLPQKPTKVTLFTMILYKSENNIRD